MGDSQVRDEAPGRSAPDAERTPMLADSSPLLLRHAVVGLAGSVGRTATMLPRKEIHQPHQRVGDVLHFADGSTGRVYRETQVRHPGVEEPSTLVVQFRLRYVRGRGHTLFRSESLLNTPLFVGFPGFVSKLWLAHDVNDVYRGVYEWSGAERAESYVRSLWWVLALVGERGSIRYVVIPGLRRDEMLRDPSILQRFVPGGGGEWWRLVRYIAR